MKLSEILRALGLEGTVTEAESGAPELFQVEKDGEGDDRTVTALRAFSSREKLSVTIDGVPLDIPVTDTQDSVVYYEYDPEMKELCQNEVLYYTPVDSSCTSLTLDAGQWYVVVDEVTLLSRPENKSQIGNPANIILTNGCTLNAPYGIENGSHNSIRIYGQDKNGGTGKLIINSSVPDNWAGIGGGCSPGQNAQGCGYVEINGGILEIHGGVNAAGIGGANGAADVSVTINAGKVTAYGGANGAGIGTGRGSTKDISGNGKIIINGGTVEAFGGEWAAGIGRGYHGYPNAVEINGGDITAKGGVRGGAGIGGGKDTSGVNTTITGGTVCAIGNVDEANELIGCGIGSGGKGSRHMSLTITGESSAIYSGPGEKDATESTAATYVRLREPYVKISITEAPVYTVSWTMDDGTSIDTTDVAEGEMPVHADAAKAGYVFTGWTPALSPVTADITYAAKFVQLPPEKVAVSFDTAGGSYVETQVIGAGEKATKPADPTREGYTFGGWYTDSTYGTEFDFSIAVNAGTVVRAKWTKNAAAQYTVTWKLDDVTTIDTAIVNAGEMPVHVDAAKTGFVFTGWTPALSPVTADITYAAKFVQLTPEKVAVSFDTAGGSYVETLVINVGEKAARPANPAKDGCTFEGWYTDGTYKTEFDFNAPVTENTVAVAKWSGSPAPVPMQLYGIVITAPPQRTSYNPGENFDPAGMAVNALYAKPITGYSLSPLTNLQKTDSAVTVTYTENGVTKSTLQPITVGGEPYKIIRGANQCIPMNAASATFASDADFGKFVRVEVDGQVLPGQYYTAESGSTVITFLNKYIPTLMEGRHTLRIVSTDGSADTEFFVESMPHTGDGSRIGLWLALLACAGTVLMLSVREKKKNEGL